MKRYSLPIFVLLFVLMGRVPDAYALDSLTKIELRNSYKQFERCMKDHNNDITRCLEEFNKALEIHKKALKTEPENEDIKNTLLLIVNTMNDIAETYYSAAETKKGIEPTLSKKYYTKAAICYNELVNLYPNKAKFKEVLKNAKYLSKYEGVEEYIFEFKSRKRLDYALLTFQKLKASRDSFNSSFGLDEKLNNDMNEVVAQLEDKVNRLFQKIVQKQNPEDMGSLIYLIQAQLSIIDFHDTQVYKENLLRLETTTIGIIKDLTDSYRADFRNANSNYDRGVYSAAAKAFDELLVKMQSFPDYNTARPDLQTRISKATDNFNIEQFRQAASQKAQVAKATHSFLSMMDKGKSAFNQKDWDSAYDTFEEADEFAKGKQLAVQTNMAREWSNKTQVAKATDSFLSMMDKGKHAFSQQDWAAAYDAFKWADEFAKGKQLAVNANVSREWLNKVQKKIDGLDDDEITNMRLANLHYKAMSYSEWLKAAKNGAFPKDSVSLSGSFQQKSDGVVILKKATIEYDWNLGVAFQGSQMNSVGLIFKKKRLFRDDDFISCIGKFKRIDRFRTVIGQEIQIPVFKVVYYK